MLQLHINSIVSCCVYLTYKINVMKIKIMVAIIIRHNCILKWFHSAHPDSTDDYAQLVDNRIIFLPVQLIHLPVYRLNLIRASVSFSGPSALD